MIRCCKFKRKDSDTIYEIYKIDGNYIYVKWGSAYDNKRRSRPVHKDKANELMNNGTWIPLGKCFGKLKRVI